MNAMSDDLMDLGDPEIDDVKENQHHNDADDNIEETIWNYYDTNIPCSDKFIGRGTLDTQHGHTSMMVTMSSFL